MSAKVSAVIISLILSLVIIFQNTTMITMKFIVFTFSIHLGILLFIAVLLGGVLVFNIFSIREDSYKLLLKSKNRQIANLKKENSKINVANFGNDVKTDSENKELYDRFKEAVTTESLSGDNYEDFEKKVDDYLTTNQGTFNYDDIFKTNYDSKEDLNNNNIPLSSFDKETFSLKSSSNNTTSSDDSNEPWYMKPFFKRGKKLEKNTIKLDVEEIKEKKSLDDLIKLDLDDMSKNMGIKPRIKSSIADKIPALDNVPNNDTMSSENIKEEISKVEEQEIQVNVPSENQTSQENASQKPEIIVQEIKDDEISTKKDSQKPEDTKNEDKSKDESKDKKEDEVQNLTDIKEKKEEHENEKVKSKKKSSKVKKNIKKLKLKSENNKDKEKITEQPISMANPPPNDSNESSKEENLIKESSSDENKKEESLKDDNPKKSFFQKMKSFKLFPKGFNWRETFKADEPDDESQE